MAVLTRPNPTNSAGFSKLAQFPRRRTLHAYHRSDESAFTRTLFAFSWLKWMRDFLDCVARTVCAEMTRRCLVLFQNEIRPNPCRGLSLLASAGCPRFPRVATMLLHEQWLKRTLSAAAPAAPNSLTHDFFTGKLGPADRAPLHGRVRAGAWPDTEASGARRLKRIV